MEGMALQPGDVVKRHRLSTRLWHWINALALLVMLMSGLMIFNAHPQLYWGKAGANADPAWLVIDDTRTTGYLEIAGLRIETTNVLGLWTDSNDQIQRRAFPEWATIPSGYSLAAARRWHFAFAWVFAVGLALYMLRSLFNGHVRKDLHIKRAEWSPSHIWHDIKSHARLRFPEGEAALSYNILQKFSYIGVIFIFLPLMIFTGLAMSPGMNAAMPWLLDIFGGRQSARSIHFIAAAALFAFFVVHMIMVLLAGPVNEVRSMVTGRFRLPGRRDPAGETS
jgi:thiosulfate reductase cytochrome b subunit